MPGWSHGGPRRKRAAAFPARLYFPWVVPSFALCGYSSKSPKPLGYTCDRSLTQAGDIRQRTCLRNAGMTKLQMKGSWNEMKGKLKQKYAQLTDDDLTFAEGKEEELLGRLQQRLGKAKEDIRRELEEL